MPFFLDNNVLIGYIFETDNWNSKSLEVMGCYIPKISSDTVKAECSDSYQKNMGKIKMEIFEIDGLTHIDLVDVEIILDAHHIGLQVAELFFITGDYMHIIPRRDIIKKNTSLKDVIGLGEFQAENRSR